MAGVDPRLSTPEWRHLAWWVRDRDHHVCQIGGPACTKVATCVDHIVARGDGGDCWDPANLRAACRACNSRRPRPGGGAAGATRATGRGRRFAYQTTLPDYQTRF